MSVQQGFYTGAPVSPTFTSRWRSKKYVGKARPWAQVQIRRGYMHHAMHLDWPDPQFGEVYGHHIRDQWYPTWTPTTGWQTLPGVGEIQLDQQLNVASQGGNGISVATVTCDNAAWVRVAGSMGAYHEKQRGWLWPWRGWVPTNRPGGKVTDQNQWYDILPNAQILVSQGYGSDTAVKMFTGLIDDVGPGSIRPDEITLTARDFGGVMVDVNPFAYNRDKRLRDPFYFIPPDYPKKAELEQDAKNLKHPHWVIVKDATDIVRCILRWSGFKEWQIEDSGVALKTAFLVDRSKTWMDVINQVAEQLGYVFFIAEPTQDNDLSIGVPIFRKRSVLRANRTSSGQLDSSILTDIQPKHDNTNDRFIIRVRGRPTSRKKGGRTILGGDMNQDGQVLYTFTYWPPWMPRMAGVIKQLTYYNIGTQRQGGGGVLGFSSTLECAVACVLIAVEIALARDTAVAQFPANPAFGLDGFALLRDDGAGSSGIVSRLYVTERKITFQYGGKTSEPIWTSELTGSLVDNPEWDRVYQHYRQAISGTPPNTTGGTGQWS